MPARRNNHNKACLHPSLNPSTGWGSTDGVCQQTLHPISALAAPELHYHKPWLINLLLLVLVNLSPSPNVTGNSSGMWVWKPSEGNGSEIQSNPNIRNKMPQTAKDDNLGLNSFLFVLTLKVKPVMLWAFWKCFMSPFVLLKWKSHVIISPHLTLTSYCVLVHWIWYVSISVHHYSTTPNLQERWLSHDMAHGALLSCMSFMYACSKTPD